MSMLHKAVDATIGAMLFKDSPPEKELTPLTPNGLTQYSLEALISVVEFTGYQEVALQTRNDSALYESQLVQEVKFLWKDIHSLLMSCQCCRTISTPLQWLVQGAEKVWKSHLECVDDGQQSCRLTLNERNNLLLDGSFLYETVSCVYFPNLLLTYTLQTPFTSPPFSADCVKETIQLSFFSWRRPPGHCRQRYCLAGVSIQYVHKLNSSVVCTPGCLCVEISATMLTLAATVVCGFPPHSLAACINQSYGSSTIGYHQRWRNPPFPVRTGSLAIEAICVRPGASTVISLKPITLSHMTCSTQFIDLDTGQGEWDFQCIWPPYRLIC